jgi:hypothetical protein
LSQEFIYTFGTSLFCFAAWVAQFSDLYGFYDPKYAWRYDAQIAAAVTCHGTLAERERLSTVGLLGLTNLY